MSKHEKGMRLIIDREFEGQLIDMCDDELGYQINETQYPEEYASNIFTMLTLLRKMDCIAMAAGYDIQFEERMKDECQDQDVYDHLLELREAWHKELITT